MSVAMPTQADVPRIAGIILAAGRARRMGRPKQLLAYRGKPLIANALAKALQVLDPVIVVLGAYCEEVRTAVDAAANGRPVHIVENANWEAGMASSIACGISYLLETTNMDAALLLAADQPLITAEQLSALCSTFSNSGTNPPPDIVAAEYGGTLGIPAVFGKQLFPRLLLLTGDRGARSLLLDPALRVTPMPCPEAALDIDTPEDAAALGSAIS